MKEMILLAMLMTANLDPKAYTLFASKPSCDWMRLKCWAHAYNACQYYKDKTSRDYKSCVGRTYRKCEIGGSYNCEE